MKKCPECGNPSYDGAPVCGNCGYKFPKPKVKAQKRETIFQSESKAKTKKTKKAKKGNEKSTLEIIYDNRLLIGAILVITLLVICGIVLTGSNNNSNDNTKTTTTSSPFGGVELVKYSKDGFSFSYPKNWEKLNETDEEHDGATFFKDENGTVIEYYSVTTDYTSLKEINQQRIINAQNQGDSVDTVETITLDGRNASNIIFEDADGDYTRYVSMFSDGKLYVFKITGTSVNALNSPDIESMLNTADIE